MTRHNVLLISSNELGWMELRAALRTIDNVSIAGEATTLAKAEQLALTLHPDIILAAAGLGEGTTIPLLLHLHREIVPLSKIIVFASHLDPPTITALNSPTFAGYLLWRDLSATTLRPYLTAVLGSTIICRSPQPQNLAIRLTEREHLVLRHLAQGYTHQEIAQFEPLSLRTVDRIVAGLEEKLDAPTQFLLGFRAAQHGLLS